MRLFLMTCDQFSTFCKHPHISLSAFKGKTDFKKDPTPVKLMFKAEPPKAGGFPGGLPVQWMRLHKGTSKSWGHVLLLGIPGLPPNHNFIFHN